MAFNAAESNVANGDRARLLYNPIIYRSAGACAFALITCQLRATTGASAFRPKTPSFPWVYPPSNLHGRWRTCRGVVTVIVRLGMYLYDARRVRTGRVSALSRTPDIVFQRIAICSPPWVSTVRVKSPIEVAASTGTGRWCKPLAGEPERRNRPVAHLPRRTVHAV